MDGKTGADVPWTTYEAKDGGIKGETLTSHDPGNVASEALSNSCVRLAATGDSVEWKIRAPANAIVVRYSIPDAPAGGGAPGTLGLFINGEFRQQLDLNSHYAWLYGPGDNPQGNDPAQGSPHHFFDEVHAFLTGAPLREGDVVSLRNRAGDGVPWCVVDLIDLETVPPPATMPEGSLSIADFGAIADDGKDDTAAIEACMAQAKAQGKIVWFPPGTYDQQHVLVLDGVAVRGAGPWYTRLTTLEIPTKEMGFKGNCGFYMTGSGSQVRDMMIEGVETSRAGPQQRALVGHPQNFLVENVWVEHTGTGAWLGPCAHGVIRRCRIRDTYADGINVNNCAQDILVEQNHCRNTGDDGLAVFSASDKGGLAGPCADVEVRQNTVEAPWWANCLGLYGGRHIVADKNLLRGGGTACGVAVTTGYKARATESMEVRDNDIVDCGVVRFKQHWGAIFIYASYSSITGLSFRGNRILHPLFDAVEIMGHAVDPTQPGNRIETELIDNEIVQPGKAFLFVRAKTEGSVRLRGNKITGLPEGQSAIVNQASSASFKIENDGATP